MSARDATGERSVGENALVSLAILTTNFERDRRTYIDQFVPFVADCLGRLEGDITVSEVQRSLASCFGIDIPLGPLSTILKRCRKLGLIDRAGEAFRPNHAALQPYDLARERQDALRGIEELIGKLCAFASARHGRRILHAQAEDLLFAYIEARGAPILRAIVGGGAMPRPATASEDEYLVGLFILDLAERDSSGFDALEHLVKGSMLAAVLYLPDMSTADRRFEDLTAYFDTPFLMGALGFNGREVEEAALELLGLLEALDVHRACLERTVHEIQGILNAVAHSLRNPNRKPVQGRSLMPYVVEHGLEPADLDVIADGLGSRITALRIKTLDAPPPSVSLTVDEGALRRALTLALPNQNEDARTHDLNALTAMYRLRRGSTAFRLEKARAIFVTPNAAIVSVARTFFASDAAGVPLAILHNDLATLAWLKRPLGAPTLPKKQILADCYSATEPDPALWSAYLSSIERMGQQGHLTQADAFMLRYTHEAQRALMTRTLGQATAVSEAAIHEVLATAKNEITSPLERRLREMEDVFARERKLREDAEARAMAEALRAAAAEEQLKATQDADREQREQAAARVMQHVSEARECARRDARMAYYAVLIAMGIAMLVAGLASLPLPAMNVVGNVGRTVARALFVGSVAVALVGTLLGFSPRGAARTVEARARLKLERRYVHRAEHDGA